MWMGNFSGPQKWGYMYGSQTFPRPHVIVWKRWEPRKPLRLTTSTVHGGFVQDSSKPSSYLGSAVSIDFFSPGNCGRVPNFDSYREKIWLKRPLKWANTNLGPLLFGRGALLINTIFQSGPRADRVGPCWYGVIILSTSMNGRRWMVFVMFIDVKCIFLFSPPERSGEISPYGVQSRLSRLWPPRFVLVHAPKPKARSADVVRRNLIGWLGSLEGEKPSHHLMVTGLGWDLRIMWSQNISNWWFGDLRTWDKKQSQTPFFRRLQWFLYGKNKILMPTSQRGGEQRTDLPYIVMLMVII